MIGVRTIPLGVPVCRGKRLAPTLRVDGPRPDLVIAGGWQLHLRRPVLPSIPVHRLLERRRQPALPVVDRQPHLADMALAGPCMASDVERTCPARQPLTIDR